MACERAEQTNKADSKAVDQLARCDAVLTAFASLIGRAAARESVATDAAAPDPSEETRDETEPVKRE